MKTPRLWVAAIMALLITTATASPCGASGTGWTILPENPGTHYLGDPDIPGNVVSRAPIEMATYFGATIVRLPSGSVYVVAIKAPAKVKAHQASKAVPRKRVRHE